MNYSQLRFYLDRGCCVWRGGFLCQGTGRGRECGEGGRVSGWAQPGQGEMNLAPMPEGFFPHSVPRWPRRRSERVRGVRLCQRLPAQRQTLLQARPSACVALSEEVTSKGFLSRWAAVALGIPGARWIWNSAVWVERQRFLQVTLFRAANPSVLCSLPSNFPQGSSQKASHNPPC